MVKQLVPKPKSVRAKRIGRILSNENILSAATYKGFKHFIRDLAKKYLPNTEHTHDAYEMALWGKVVGRVLRRYPQVKQCVGVWPIDAYYDSWVVKARQNRARFVRLKSYFAAISGSGRAGRTPIEPRVVFSSSQKSDTLIDSENGLAEALFARGTTSQAETAKKDVPDLRPQTSAPFQPSASRTRTYIFDASTTVKTYPEPCSLCGLQPRILDEHQIGLTNFLNVNCIADMAPALRSFGILHDGHLRTLLSLTDGDREGIIRGMSQFLARPDLFILAKHLKDAAKMFNMVISAPQTACVPSVEESAYSCWCGSYSPNINNPISRKLGKLLKSQHLEVLVPIAATLYGITTDAQFERVCKFSEEDLGLFMNIESRRVSSFYHRLLRLVLQKGWVCS